MPSNSNPIAIRINGPKRPIAGMIEPLCVTLATTGHDVSSPTHNSNAPKTTPQKAFEYDPVARNVYIPIRETEYPTSSRSSSIMILPERILEKTADADQYAVCCGPLEFSEMRSPLLSSRHGL
jgi:hypothetical protein